LLCLASETARGYASDQKEGSAIRAIRGERLRDYRSSIPKGARERVTATFVSGPQKYKAECVFRRKIVGIRYYHETGEPSLEVPLKNGIMHGILYSWYTSGKLTSAAPYRNGREHGTARQWSDGGELIGTYTMKHGTGIDLWWQDYPNRTPHLAEIRYMSDGMRHGFEWWLNQRGRSVHEECHFHSDKKHGVERSWNSRGRLRRGYPKYWVRDERLTKSRYIRECAKDPSLPPFRERENRPQRRFPLEIGAH
jgi:hypothetical protein